MLQHQFPVIKSKTKYELDREVSNYNFIISKTVLNITSEIFN